MRHLAGADLVAFHSSEADLLALDGRGEFIHLEASDVVEGAGEDCQFRAYSEVPLTDGRTVQILCERGTLTGGRSEGTLTGDGTLDPGVAEEMAATVNEDSGLTVAVQVHEARAAGTRWEASQSRTDSDALLRAMQVSRLADMVGQSEAGRRLSIDQSTVNRLVKKFRSVIKSPTVHHTSSADAETPVHRDGEWTVVACKRPGTGDTRVTVTTPTGHDVVTVTADGTDDDDAERGIEHATSAARSITVILPSIQEVGARYWPLVDADSLAGGADELAAKRLDAGKSAYRAARAAAWQSIGEHWRFHDDARGEFDRWYDEVSAGTASTATL